MALETQLTIFTPTYNRAYILPDLYKSLCDQTDKSFIWMIVDDGSTDDTEHLVQGWINEGRLRILYFKQANGGKHVAHNVAAEKCETGWCMCVDSDDRLTLDAVETINRLIEEERVNASVIGFVGPRGNLNGKKIYSGFPNERYVRFYDIYDKYRFKGETGIVFRTEVLRKHSFPVFEGEKYLPENVSYREIDKEGIFRTIQKIIYCFEYIKDGYTSNTLKTIIENPNGYLLSLETTVNNSSSAVDRAKAYAYYRAVANAVKMKKKTDLKQSVSLRIVLLSIPFMPHYMLKMKNAVRKYKNDIRQIS